MSDYTVVDSNVSLQNFFTTWIDVSGTTESGGTSCELYANGVMKSCMFIKYDYFLPEQGDEAPNSEQLSEIDDAMQSYFINSNHVYIYDLSNDGVPLGGENSSWGIGLDNNKFRNDVYHDGISERPTPSYTTSTKAVSGWIRVFLTPPKAKSGTVKLKVFGTYTSTQVTQTIDLNCSELSIPDGGVMMEYIDQLRSSNENYTRLHSLKYNPSAGLPQTLKLLGIEKKGKYGLTLGTSSFKRCNINISYMKDSDCKIAGFFDEQLTATQPGASGFKLILGANETTFTGTDFKGPDDSEQGQDNTGSFWCNKGNWTSPESLLSTSVTNAFNQGIPMVLCHKDGDYKIRLNNSDGSLYQINYANKQQYAYDNCGNRVTFEIDYKTGNWDSKWEDGKWPIALTASYYSGGYGE